MINLLLEILIATLPDLLAFARLLWAEKIIQNGHIFCDLKNDFDHFLPLIGTCSTSCAPS